VRSSGCHPEIVAPATDTGPDPGWGRLADVRTGLAITVVTGTWLAAVTIGWAASYPSADLAVVFVALVLVALTGLAWLVLTISEIVLRRFALAVALTVLAGLVIGGAGIAARIELPLLARFAASRPAFDQVIADRGEAGPGAPCPRRIGSYRILSCRTLGSDTYFRARDGGFLDSVGFVYLPEGVPTDPPTGTSITYGQLRGPWYSFVEAW
jgi:hypothetical protein